MHKAEAYPLEIDGYLVWFFPTHKMKWWWCDAPSNAKASELLRQINQHSDHPAVKLYLQSDYNQSMTLEEFLEAANGTN